jgi:O-antigen ligase
MPRKNEPSLFELLSQLPAQVGALVKAEYENAKREISSKLKKLGLGALLVLFALFFVFFSLGAFVAAAIAGIAIALPLWAAALIVAFSLLVLAGLVLFIGFNRISKGNPVPEETLGRIERDFETLAEKRYADDDEF